MRIFFHGLSRFSLLAFVLLFVIGPFTKANSETGFVLPYRLHFFHTRTGERLDIVYRHGDTYDSSALSTLNHYLRDHRTNDVHAYDPRVFDLLHDLVLALGRPDAEINVVCGYRTPRSNEYLRSHGHGVADTACTCRRWPLIYGSQTLVRPSSAMSLCRCTAEAWDITPRPILYT